MRQELLDAVFDQDRVSGLTHNFYRYPARFSPKFAREMIREFSEPGDLVYDPFVGGGTTLVEARTQGRLAVGTDINSLAVFVSQVKTTKLSDADIDILRRWAKLTLPSINLRKPSSTPLHWVDAGYQINIDTRKTWRMRKAVELFLERINDLELEHQRNFARCALLNTAQWALDCRKTIPSIDQFRATFMKRLELMLLGARDFARLLQANPVDIEIGHDGVACFEQSVKEVEKLSVLKKHPPKLIVTSPPYPGTHVLYHRWQVQGRRETKAAYWIANKQDSHSAPYYCMGSYRNKDNSDYFENLLQCFTALARIVRPDTLVVQMMAFPQPERQLEKYLEAMRQAGFHEIKKAIGMSDDGRLWRTVPSRKFYARHNGHGTGNEVVLFHSRCG
jgi:hypothetical protein